MAISNIGGASPVGKRLSTMSTATSSVAFNNLSNLYGRNPSRFQAPLLSPDRLSWIPTAKFGHLSANQGLHIKRFRKMEMNAADDLQQQAPLPSRPALPPWFNWVLGSMLPILVPFFNNNKWGQIVAFKNDVDKAIVTAESITEVVEEVAEEVEKVAEEVAEKLPDDAKIKGLISMVENLAKQADKDAELAEEIINKVEEAEKEVETLLEPAMDQEKQASQKSA